MRRMGREADYFRERADTCRRLAGSARDEVAYRELTRLADELEAEADMIDAEERIADPPAVGC